MAEAIGFNPVVWIESLSKRLVDASAGRGGLEALLQYLDQIDFIPELRPIRQNIKNISNFFETAIPKCTKEMLKRPLHVREDEVLNFLGYKCLKCGHQVNLRMAWILSLGGKCPTCGEYLTSLYAELLRRLVRKGVDVSPEVIIMHEAYDRIAQAFVDAYKALRLVMDKTAELFGHEGFRVDQPQIRFYMEELFLGRLAGEQKIPREEKEMLQFLVRGNIANIPVDEAEHLIRLGIEIVKYGYLFQVLGAIGADSLYDESLTKFNLLYDQLNERIRTTFINLYSETKKQVIRVSKTLGGYYAPCLLMPRHCWETGRIAKDITLEPVYHLPIFPKADYGPLQAIYGPRGSGKTFLLESIISYAVLSKHEMVFCPLNDKSNSYALACLPFFPYSRVTKSLTRTLRGLGVEPQALPTLTLTVLRRGDKVRDLEQHPATIYDRVIEVDDPRGFEIDFNLIVEELKENAEGFGYAKPTGVVNVRNLDRYYYKENVNIDVQITTNLLTQFDRWRKSHLSIPARVVFDEVSYLAASQIALYSGDAFHSGATISDFIKESRRDRISLELATQLPLEIIPDIRNAATNVFFRDLAASKDKARSQIDFLLESLLLEDPSVKGVIREINNRGLLGKGYWFWYHQPARSVEVVNPCPPTFCILDPDAEKTNREIFKLYEKQSGEKILLDSWKQVKTFKAEKVKLEEVMRDVG